MRFYCTLLSQYLNFVIVLGMFLWCLFQNHLTMTDENPKLWYQGVTEFLTWGECATGDPPVHLEFRMRLPFIFKWSVGLVSSGGEGNPSKMSHYLGHSVEATFEENIGAVEQITKKDQWVTMLKIANTLGVGLAMVDRIIREHCNMLNVCACCVPRMLMLEMKQN